MPKPGGCHSSGISLGDVLRLPKRHPAWRRREAQSGSCMERENLAGDAKGEGASGSNREAESTDAPERVTSTTAFTGLTPIPGLLLLLARWTQASLPHRVSLRNQTRGLRVRERKRNKRKRLSRAPLKSAAITLRSLHSGRLSAYRRSCSRRMHS